MKNILLTISIFITTCAFAQVAIGKSSTTNTSVSLEFYDNADNAKGLVLPWVTSTAAVTGAVNGTMVYNSADKKVYVKYNSGWKDLSIDTNGTTIDPITSVDGLTLQNTLNDLTTAKAQIGGNPTTDTTPGILVLADNNKAMVLPKVASPHLTIINPAPGMMAYDTVKKQLAVYNGTNWTFWTY